MFDSLKAQIKTLSNDMSTKIAALQSELSQSQVDLQAQVDEVTNLTTQLQALDATVNPPQG